jgi:hypothetical protein
VAEAAQKRSKKFWNVMILRADVLRDCERKCAAGVVADGSVVKFAAEDGDGLPAEQHAAPAPADAHDAAAR